MTKRDKLLNTINEKQERIRRLTDEIKDYEAELKKLDMIEAYGFKQTIEATGLSTDLILAAIKSGDPQQIIDAMTPSTSSIRNGEYPNANE